MKYTKEQAEKAKQKDPVMVPKVIIKDGYYIIESKMNYL